MFLDDLAKAKRPAILVGGGAFDARHWVEEAAWLHGMPIFRTWNALDIATDDMPTYCGTVGTYGGPGRNFGIQNCDLLLALGCRFSGRITGGQPETFARGAKKYIVNVDDDPTAGQVQGEHIKRDCKDFLRDSVIYKGGGERALRMNEWLDVCREWLFKYDPVRPEMLKGEFHHYGFMRRLSELLPNNAIIVSDTGGNVIMMGHCFRSKRGQRIFTSNGNTPMGFAMCGAIGAWFADPTRPVICIIGDGGMCMNSQELQTLVNYGIPLKVFVINNHVLGNTASFQRVNGMKQVACAAPDYVPPDFCKLALAYGVETERLTTWEGLEPCVIDALASEVAVVVDVVHHDFAKYEPRLSVWQGGIEEMYPPLPRAEFLQNMAFVPPIEGWEQRAREMK